MDDAEIKGQTSVAAARKARRERRRKAARRREVLLALAAPTAVALGGGAALAAISSRTRPAYEVIGVTLPTGGLPPSDPTEVMFDLTSPAPPPPLAPVPAPTLEPEVVLPPEPLVSGGARVDPPDAQPVERQRTVTRTAGDLDPDWMGKWLAGKRWYRDRQAQLDAAKNERTGD